MPLSINTNVASLTAQRAMINSNAGLETSFERLATGKRVNSASDDAAGLAIGKDLESRVSGLNQAIRNVNDGISMVQIAEGTLDEVTTILQRMRDLAVQAANGSLSADERGYLDTEASKLATTLGKVIDQSEMNGTDLNSDTAQTAVTIQSGADSGETTLINFKALTENLLGVSDTTIDLAGTLQQKEAVTLGPTLSTGTGTHLYSITIDGVKYSGNGGVEETVSNFTHFVAHFTDATADDGTVLGDLYDISSPSSDLKLVAKVNGNLTAADYTLAIESSTLSSGDTTAFAVGSKAIVEGKSTAADAITAIDAALATVAKERAVLGATQSQLESTVRNLANVAENTSAAAGRIMDTDYAAETANLTKAQILQQAATSILAQANAQPQSVLSLLQ
jgi:flagellin